MYKKLNMIEDDEVIDICVVTYNRLEYLKNCIWSIIASTSIKYRIIVIDDCSTDKTGEWLAVMKTTGKIDEYIINEKNLGSPKSINKVINFSKSSKIAIISDDIWVHRGWDIKSLDVYNKYEDCGMVSFWNYPVERYKNKKTVMVEETVFKHQNIGVAALILDRNLFKEVGGYSLPGGLKMGYFSKLFCKKAEKAKIKRNKQYLVTNPYYAEQMDRNNPKEELPPPRLNQEHLYLNYNERRTLQKQKHKNLKNT